MNHRPVCVKCQVEMRPEKNGIGVLDMADFGPYKIWDADKWKCPKCAIEVIIGFGQQAIAEHYEAERFKHFCEGYEEQGLLIKCWQWKE